MKQVTQQQVAELANVSRATVSYVLNGRDTDGVVISDETRRRVLGAIEQLGYRPNFQAKNLRSGKSYTIGVLVLDLHNPHFWQYLAGIESEAHRQGYAIMLFHTALRKSEEDVAIRELSHKRIDGAIINMSYGLTVDKDAKELGLSGLPIVDLSSQDSPFDHVVCDYHEATADLMHHLYDLGHRQFGFIYGVANRQNGLDRLDPYQAFAKEHGLSPEQALVVDCEPSQESAYEAAIALLGQPKRPTAVVAINDYLALSVLRAAADLGLRVPQDVSVAGYDDIPFSQFSVPRLTTVSRETERAGVMAFQLLAARMNDATGPVQTARVGGSLQIRESTGPVTQTEVPMV